MLRQDLTGFGVSRAQGLEVLGYGLPALRSRAAVQRWGGMWLQGFGFQVSGLHWGDGLWQDLKSGGLNVESWVSSGLGV